MPSGRAERPFLSILCGVSIATASLPAGAAVTHAPSTATPPVAAPVDDGAAPTDAASTPAAPTEPATEPAPSPTEATPPEPPPTTSATTTTPTPEPAPATPKPAPAESAPAKSVPAEPAATEEGEDTSELPQRLTPMQTAGWWTLFGGVAVGTLAGVMAGLAERREDRALRLSVRFELDTGAQTRFEDVQGEYDSALRRGRAQANAGIALAVIGLAAAVAGIAVLGVAGVRQRKAANRKDSARLQWRGSGMQVRF